VLALLAFALAFGAKWGVLRLLAVCAAGGLLLSL
jgi:chromate transporter